MRGFRSCWEQREHAVNGTSWSVGATFAGGAKTFRCSGGCNVSRGCDVGFRGRPSFCSSEPQRLAVDLGRFHGTRFYFLRLQAWGQVWRRRHLQVVVSSSRIPPFARSVALVRLRVFLLGAQAFAWRWLRRPDGPPAWASDPEPWNASATLEVKARRGSRHGCHWCVCDRFSVTVAGAATAPRDEPGSGQDSGGECPSRLSAACAHGKGSTAADAGARAGPCGGAGCMWCSRCWPLAWLFAGGGDELLEQIPPWAQPRCAWVLPRHGRWHARAHTASPAGSDGGVR